MITVNIHNVIDNDSFFGMGERGYITNMVEKIRDSGTDDLLISINSPGGYVFDGYPLVNEIANKKGQVITRADGYAASMAATILAMGDVRQAYENSRIMIHKAFNPYGDLTEEEQNELNIMNNNLANVFKRVMNSDLVDEIFAEDNNKNYWFSAKQAKKIGLVTEILPSNRGAQNSEIKSEVKKMQSKCLFWNKENIFYTENKGNDMFNKEQIANLTKELENIKAEIANISILSNDDVKTIVNNVLDSKLSESENNFNALTEKITNLENVVNEIKEELLNVQNVAKKDGTEQESKVNEIQDSVSGLVKRFENLIENLKKTSNNFETGENVEVNSNIITSEKTEEEENHERNKFLNNPENHIKNK